MKQLTGLDATFLHLETGAQFGHVSGLSIYAGMIGERRASALRGRENRRSISMCCCGFCPSEG